MTLRGPGALVGKIAFYGNANRSADVVAARGSVLYRVDRETLDKLDTTHPALVSHFHAIAATYLARRLNRSTRVLGAILN